MKKKEQQRRSEEREKNDVTKVRLREWREAKVKLAGKMKKWKRNN